jgi:hypothetical protein
MSKRTTRPKTTVPTREEARTLAHAQGHTMGAWQVEKAVSPLSRDEEACISRCATPGCELTLLEVRRKAGTQVRIGRLQGGLACPTRYRWPAGRPG